MPAVSAFWKFNLQNAALSAAVATLSSAVLQNVLQKREKALCLSMQSSRDL